MNDGVVVKVENLGKRFKIYGNPWGRAKEWLTLGTRTDHKNFWALKNISFDLKRGESLGIIGPNGAGKSTLLKILTGALYPTEGEYHINGRVLSLLELGTGFNPELTGRSNVFYSAQLLGFPDAYVAQRVDDIEAFAELGDFFDRPLKFYSSGMRARLGFSLFAFLECSVLIIDEVLAVGDVFFKQKCYARLEELMNQNTAIILVTHSMAVVQQYCQEVMVLDRGEVVFHGHPSEAIKRYLFLGQNPGRKTVSDSSSTAPSILDEDAEVIHYAKANLEASEIPFWPAAEAFIDLSRAVSVGEGWARCTGIALCDSEGRPCRVFQQGERADFYYEFEALCDLEVPIGSIGISNDRNIVVHGKTTLQHQARVPPCVRKGMRIRFRQTVVLDVIPGEYSFSIGFATMSHADYSNIEYMSHQEIASRTTRVSSVDRAGSFSVTFRRGEGLPLLHYGLCNLPGDCVVQVVLNTSAKVTSQDPHSGSGLRSKMGGT